MSVEVKLPALGESVTEGTVTRWLKNVGDTVAADEPLLEVSTDKVDTEIPAPAAGVIVTIAAPEDSVVEVGGLLCVIGTEAAAEAAPTPAPPAAPAPSAPAAAPPAAASGFAPPTTPPQGGFAPPPPVAGSTAGAAAPAGVAAGPQVSVAPSGFAAPSGYTSPSFGAPPANSPAPGAPSAAPPPPPPAAPVPPAPAAPPAPQAAEPAVVLDEAAGFAALAGVAGGGGDASADTHEVTLPALGESVTEGTVTRWLKAVGDQVAVDEPLLEVSTDKVDTEIPSPAAGVLQEIRVAEDETAEVGAVLAIVGSGAPVAATPVPAAPSPVTAPVPAPGPAPVPARAATPEPRDETGVADAVPHHAAAPAAANAPVAPATGAAVYVTPLVRKMARDAGVDIADIQGSGVGGRIRREDVQAAVAAQGAVAAAAAVAEPAAVAVAQPAVAAGYEPPPDSDLRGTTVNMTRLRRTIAARMVESLQTEAQLTTVVEVDVTRIANLRNARKAAFREANGINLTFLPFFALSAVQALKAYPVVNASIDLEAGTVTYPAEENLGIAVDTERGLLVPVVRNAGDLSITGLSLAIADLAERTRSGKLSPDDLSGGTFTLTNTGSRGALFDTPIINAPQSAILGTGAVVKRPVVVSDGEGGEAIAVRSMMYLALSYDHRLVDGADAARFLTAVKTHLESGDFGSDF
ncbi:MAG: 2-oxoglutarate dehydrogenase, E2 component, dihydrolipoamide succinyltransferase [Actinobacteria bacterium]|nr:MAG: 2-oxoglutarate dehydrogenase, E2 component, dihydrolipoamide succinyltransferase [Actinomycetota bacterium]